MIGYLIEQELGNLLPFERPFASILTMVEVDPADPAFADPTKFIGPVYEREEAERLAAEKGWAIKPDGDKWRRVVASPVPVRIFEIRPITLAARAGRRRHLHRRRRHPDDVPAGHPHAGRRGGRDRQGPGERAARGAARGGPVRDGHRRRRGLPGLRHATAGRHRPDDAVAPGGDVRCRPARWAPRSRPRSRSSGTPASAPRSARSPSSATSSLGPGTRIEPDGPAVPSQGDD